MVCMYTTMVRLIMFPGVVLQEMGIIWGCGINVLNLSNGIIIRH